MVDGSTRAAALAVLEFSAQGSNAGSGVYGGHSQPEANQPALQQQQQQYPCAQQQQPLPPPQLLARFRVNSRDTMSVFRAVSPEDLADVAALLPPGTTLPGAGRMTYLVARLEVLRCMRYICSCIYDTHALHSSGCRITLPCPALRTHPQPSVHHPHTTTAEAACI
jgi:hypothetical protein